MGDFTSKDFSAHYPGIARINHVVLENWPEHAGFLARRYKDDTPEFLSRCERLAQEILLLCGSRLDEFCSDYRWMCEKFFEEEILFRRTGHYRISTLAEATAQVYDNAPFMKRYMYGLLVSQLLWRNHTCVIDSFSESFLESTSHPFEYLEIGPGHGLFLARAAAHPLCTAAVGWDISESSLKSTRHALDTLGVGNRVSLEKHNATDCGSLDQKFDLVTISEVLEHLEDPATVLRALVQAMRPGGRIFVNAPVNSPAPDHIYLWRTPEEFVSFVSDCGLEVENTFFYPATGVSLEKARRAAITISCVITARSPE